MKAVFRLRDINLVLHGSVLAATGFAIYQAIAELLGEHRTVRVIVIHRDDDGAREATRMVLTPPDLAFQVTGDGSDELQPTDGLVESFKKDFEELGRVAIPDLQDVVDAFERGASAGS